MTLVERLRVLSNADKLTQDELDTVMAAIRRIESLQKELSEREREFQREARDIAVEARWEERQSRDDDYGSY
jgi:DNA repair exonuclease SbcCD ATPase subunit